MATDLWRGRHHQMTHVEALAAWDEHLGNTPHRGHRSPASTRGQRGTGRAPLRFDSLGVDAWGGRMNARNHTLPRGRTSLRLTLNEAEDRWGEPSWLCHPTADGVPLPRPGTHPVPEEAWALHCAPAWRMRPRKLHFYQLPGSQAGSHGRGAALNSTPAFCSLPEGTVHF